MVKLYLFEKSTGSGGKSFFCRYIINKKRVGSRCVLLGKKGAVESSFQSPQLEGIGWKPRSEKSVPVNVMKIFQQEAKELEIVRKQFKKREHGKKH